MYRASAALRGADDEPGGAGHGAVAARGRRPAGTQIRGEDGVAQVDEMRRFLPPGGIIATDRLDAIRQKAVGRVILRSFDLVQDDLAGKVYGILGSDHWPVLLESRGACDYYVD